MPLPMAIRVTNDGFSNIGASVAIDNIPDSRDRVKLAEIGYVVARLNVN